MIKSFKIDTTYIESFSIFFLLSIPSIKILYSSSLINFIPIILLIFSLFHKEKLKIPQFKKNLIQYWSLFSIILILFYLNGLYIDSIDIFIKYIFLFTSILLIIVFTTYKHLKIINLIIIFWGVFLALWQLTYGIPTYREFGQHYLTVSLPIGVACVNLLIVLFFGKKLKYRLGYLMLFCITFLSLGTLLSRSAIIFPIIIFLLSFVLIGFFRKDGNNYYKLLFLIILLFFINIDYTNLLNFIDFKQAKRLVLTLESLGDEGRIDSLYKPAINLIYNSPIIGHGTNSSKYLLGFYPHNIFLEILVSGGVVLFSIFLLFISKFLKYFFKTLIYARSNIVLLGFSSSAMFFLMQWNTSFDLTVSYIPIGAMFIFIIGYLDRVTQLNL